MNIFLCILEIYPDWSGLVKDNSYEGVVPSVTEKRPTPTLEELTAVWPAAEVKEKEKEKKLAYEEESDPLFSEFQVLSYLGHPDAEIRKLQWEAKREEIQKRFEGELK